MAGVYGEEDVHISSHQALLFKDGGGNGLPGARGLVQDAQPAHAGDPDGTVLGVGDVVGLEAGSDRQEKSPVLRAVAVKGETVPGNDPQAAFGVQRHAGGAERVELAEHGEDDVLVREIAVEGTVVGKQYLAATGFQDGAHVEGAVLHRNAVESALVGGNGHAVDRGYAQAAVLQRLDGVDLVVGEAGFVVGAEELLELMAVKAVEPAQGCHPDVAQLVLGKGVDALVGHALRHDDASFGRSGYVSSVVGGTGTKGYEAQGQDDNLSHIYKNRYFFADGKKPDTL